MGYTHKLRKWCIEIQIVKGDMVVQLINIFTQLGRCFDILIKGSRFDYQCNICLPVQLFIFLVVFKLFI